MTGPLPDHDLVLVRRLERRRAERVRRSMWAWAFVFGVWFLVIWLAWEAM